MYFKRLEMQGFKSFAEPVVIDFHEGITCIVGPNGSGKSNISDAIRWVLGEQSPKALRGGKMEEVIFNGTESRRPRGMSEVTLVIDNSEGKLDIEYKEVAITRRMFRSGESDYLINGNPCRLKDIRELIMDTGIGVDGYSIIGQGKIADIISNKPESRREIFEESAGVVAYKTRKAEAERKLADTRNNLERIDDIIGEIESRIGGLEEDSKKAKRYLELQDSYRGLGINITLHSIETAQKAADQYRGDIADLTGKITFAEGNRKEAETRSIELSKRSAALDRISEETHAKLVENVEKINRLLGESKLNEEKVAGLDREETRLNEEIEELNRRLEKGQEELGGLKDQLEEVRRASHEAENKLSECVYKYDQIGKYSNRYDEMMDDNNERIISLNSEAASKRSEARSIENYKQTMTQRQRQLVIENEELDKSIRNQKEALKDSEHKLKDARDRKERLDKENAERTYRRAELSQKRENVSKSIEKIRIEIGRQEARRKTIQELEQNFDGYNYAVKYIMRCGLTGIEGVVGESMEVGSGLETAIETALGAAMQNIICADDQSARRAITALKINRSGRLTFLPVESIRGSKAELPGQVISDPGYKGLGVDLIGFKPRHRKVFEYLLGRVAIVEDLNTAIRLSKICGRGVRFVTLEGEVINASGAITGGKYKNQTANLLERKNEISELAHTMEREKERLAAMEKERDSLDASMAHLVREQKMTEEDDRDSDLAMAAMRQKIEALNNSISAAEIKHNKNQVELETIARELTEADGMIERMLDESKEAENEIEKLSRDVEEINADIQQRQKAIEEAAKEVTEARIEVNQWNGKVTSIEQLVRRVEQEAADFRRQAEDKSNQLIDIQRQKNRVSMAGSSSYVEVEELSQERTSLNEQSEELRKEKAEVSEKLQELSDSQERWARELNNCRDQKYQLQIKAAKNETQLDTLKDRLWEDFEVSYAQAMDYKEDHFAYTSGQREYNKIRKELREIGPVNIGAIEEYDQVRQRYDFLTEQRSDVQTAMQELKTIIEQLDKTITRTFRDNFNQVEYNFEKVFEELFGGGHAELQMEDESDPLESGIEIVAQPPGKRLQNINLLSGGEKTMTAIALMFAVLKTRPTPFCILDEVEAALDDENIRRFTSYLKEFAETQFALITHQKATMEHADVLYGITMPEHGVSKVLSLRLGDYDPNDYAS